MQLKLPEAAIYIPCFKSYTQVYLLIGKTLYSFTPLQVKPDKTLPQSIYYCKTSYYIRGTLYNSVDSGLGSFNRGCLTHTEDIVIRLNEPYNGCIEACFL
jgi:hypothetical protein